MKLPVRLLIASLLSFAATALPAAAQIVASSNFDDPAAGLWHIDVTSGDRTLLSTDWGQSVAVDHVGGRVLFARGYELLSWNYGGGLNSASVLGTVRSAGGSPIFLTGLAYGGGRLYGATTDRRVWEISTSTLSAGATPVVNFIGFVWGLSYDSATGLFHVAEEVGTAPYRIDIHAVDLNGGGAPSFVRRLTSWQGANACVYGGIAYAMGPYGVWISRHDLVSGVEDEKALRAPWGVGYADCGSEYAPGLVPPSGVAVFCEPSTQASSVSPHPIGVPSASAGSGFALRHVRVYGGARVQPHFSFSGRSPSPLPAGYRCLNPPVFRLPPAVLPGNANVAFDWEVDFNAVIANGVHPALVAGQTVWFQASLRAPIYGPSFVFPPAVEFTILP